MDSGIEPLRMPQAGDPHRYPQGIRMRSRHNLNMLFATRPITAARSGWHWRKPSA
jgi:hypothetical protein